MSGATYTDWSEVTAEVRVRLIAQLASGLGFARAHAYFLTVEQAREEGEPCGDDQLPLVVVEGTRERPGRGWYFALKLHRVQ